MTTTVLKLRSAFSPVRACAVAALMAILSQFTLAGLALFVSASLWSAHITVGLLVAMPLTALLVLTRRRSRHADLARPARWLAMSYVVQVLLAAAADGPGLVALRALHVGNAALVLVAAWQLAQRALNPPTAPRTCSSTGFCAFSRPSCLLQPHQTPLCVRFASS